MSLGVSRLGILIAVAGALGFGELGFGQDKTLVAAKRPVSVADAIRMTRIAGSAYQAVRPKSGFAVFSPDQKRFAIVLAKGNIENNSNEYFLLVFRVAEVPHGGAPKMLVSFASTSNRVGISNIRWSDDNDTIFFLGARGEAATQLYSVRCSSREVVKLVSHPTPLISYGVSKRLGTVVFAAEESERDLISSKILRNGLHVQKEAISELIRGRTGSGREELFIKKNRSSPERQLQTLGQFYGRINDPMHVSPDGRYLVLKTDAMEVPQNWNEYHDSDIQAAFRRGFNKGSATGILRYELLDMQTGRSEPLLDAPTTYSSDVLWSPDSKSVLLCKTYLPLDTKDPIELQSRRSSQFVLAVSLPSRKVVKITNQELNPVRWNSQSNVVQFQRQGESTDGLESIYYRKTGEIWLLLPDGANGVIRLLPDILAEQDLNMPPQIIAEDPKTKQKTRLLDLNPQFEELAFGKVEEINWKDGLGNSVSGGLYLPPDYVRGVKYPLVIQTHGFEPHTFSIDGPHPTAAAAQPLAGKEIVVLQIKDIFYDTLDTLQELERAMSTYEKAVEYLDQRGIIDSSRVGLMGFSRTCMYVKYTLTHSSKHLSAAVIADGADAGYFQYLLFYNVDPEVSSDSEAIIGASPFGPGLLTWFKNSPGFLLDKVQTPVQIQALSRESVLGEWQWFEGLKRLGKPVDMVYMPTGTHVLVKPWDRIVSQEGALDWFCFWLKGEEDSSPKKAEQYGDWHKLRAQFLNPHAED